MKKQAWAILILGAFLLALVVGGCGQSAPSAKSAEPQKPVVKYPEKAITALAFTGPGGGADLFARQSGKALQTILGKPFMVENRVGGSGAIAMQTAATANPDGYTLLGITNTLLITPLRNTTPKSMADFVPIARLVLDPMVVYVRADSKYDTNTFLDAIKNGDRSIKIACPQAGSPETMAIETLVKKHNAKGIHMIPYPDTSKVIPAILGGDVDASMSELAELIPQIEAKTVKVVMSLTTKRLEKYPDIPTFVEKGYADVSVDKFRGYAVVKGTPPEVIKILEEAMKKSLDDPDYKKTIATNYQVPAYLGSADFAKFLKETEDKYKVFFTAGKK